MGPRFTISESGRASGAWDIFMTYGGERKFLCTARSKKSAEEWRENMWKVYLNGWNDCVADRDRKEIAVKVMEKDKLMSKWIDPTQQVLDTLKKLDKMDAARKIEDAMAVIKQLEVVNDVRRLAETLNREAAEHGIVMDTEFERAGEFNNADGSLPMAAAASEITLDDLLPAMTAADGPGIPEDSEWWKVDMCVECGDPVGGPGPGSEAGVTATVRMRDGADWSRPFAVHKSCVWSLLSRVLEDADGPQEDILLDGKLVVSRLRAEPIR